MAEEVRVLEFYSGIGGLRFSLKDAGVEAMVVEAFEINEIANDVYEHNFGHRPNQGNIQRLTVQQLDNYKASTWLLSPPCQPYTRQGDKMFAGGNALAAGLRKDAEDARAFSFLQILAMLPQMISPPTNIFVENVVGFESSVTHSQLMAMLKDAGFVTQEFILSPLQFGIPYSRPRYFCLAKMKHLAFGQPDLNGHLLCQPGPLVDLIQSPSHLPTGKPNKENRKIADPDSSNDQTSSDSEFSNMAIASQQKLSLVKMNEPELDPAVCCRPLSDYLEMDPCALDVPPLLKKPTGLGCGSIEGDMETQGEFSSLPAGPADKWELYKLPANVVERWGDVFGDSRRCCCFTKSYGRYAKGTGSCLATKNVSEQGELENLLHQQGKRPTPDLYKMVPLTDLGLRYFTPREVANLHSFPSNFSFPQHVSLRQRYALLGNSLSVAVVGLLLRYLFSTLPSEAKLTTAEKEI